MLCGTFEDHLSFEPQFTKSNKLALDLDLTLTEKLCRVNTVC